MTTLKWQNCLAQSVLTTLKLFEVFFGIVKRNSIQLASCVSFVVCVRMCGPLPPAHVHVSPRSPVPGHAPEWKTHGRSIFHTSPESCSQCGGGANYDYDYHRGITSTLTPQLEMYASACTAATAASNSPCSQHKHGQEGGCASSPPACVRPIDSP